MYDFELTKLRSVFTRRGYRVDLFYTHRGRRTLSNPYGIPATFFGADGRKVRAEALRFAKEDTERRNLNETAPYVSLAEARRMNHEERLLQIPFESVALDWLGHYLARPKRPGLAHAVAMHAMAMEAAPAA